MELRDGLPPARRLLTDYEHDASANLIDPSSLGTFRAMSCEVVHNAAQSGLGKHH
jgi:hypothetical protein